MMEYMMEYIYILCIYIEPMGKIEDIFLRFWTSPVTALAMSPAAVALRSVAWRI